MKRLKTQLAFAMALLLLVPAGGFASSHREAPITALDHSADVTDWYAFVSYDHPDRVPMILNVDPPRSRPPTVALWARVIVSDTTNPS